MNISKLQQLKGNMSTKVGKYAVVDKGTLIIYDNDHVAFSLSDLQIFLNFCNDEATTNSQISFEAKNNKELHFTLTNFNSITGTMPTKMLRVGTFENQNLWFSFIVYKVAENKILHYTWFIEQ